MTLLQSDHLRDLPAQLRIQDVGAVIATLVDQACRLLDVDLFALQPLKQELMSSRVGNLMALYRKI